jgi:hypothetical protein
LTVRFGQHTRTPLGYSRLAEDGEELAARLLLQQPVHARVDVRRDAILWSAGANDLQQPVHARVDVRTNVGDVEPQFRVRALVEQRLGLGREAETRNHQRFGSSGTLPSAARRAGGLFFRFAWSCR